MREAFFKCRGKQRDVALAGVGAERFQRRAADAALGCRHRADEGRIVVVVRQKTQVGGDVLDLRLVEERLPAREQVGHALVAQELFERARLEVAAVEDRVVGKLRAVFELVRLQLHDDEFGLLLAVLAHGHRDRVAVAEVGPQLLVEQLLVVRDDGVRRLEDAHRRAVVLFELDQLEVRIVARQAAEVLDIGAAPAVDRLVVVTDRRERRARAGELLEQTVLAGVGVLVLVDEQVAQAVLPFIEHFRVLVEQLDRQRDEVVEIDRLIRLERRRVAGVSERGEFLGLILDVLQGDIGRDERVLPVRDQSLQAADRRLVGAAREVGDDAVAVGRVEDREARLVAEHLRFFAQDAHAERVEGRDG